MISVLFALPSLSSSASSNFGSSLILVDFENSSVVVLFCHSLANVCASQVSVTLPLCNQLRDGTRLLFSSFPITVKGSACSGRRHSLRRQHVFPTGPRALSFYCTVCSLSRVQGAIESIPPKRSRSTLAIQICRPSTAIYLKSFGRGASWISRLQRKLAATSKRLFNSTHGFLQSSTRFSTRLQSLFEVNV